ncbi:MAG: alpha-amylase family glycosyl hydrolase [Sphingomonadales bacterium]
MRNKIILLLLMLAMGLPVSWAQPSDWPKNPVIYEVNLRHHTPEGSIAAFRRELPKLKQLGVNVLWFMPVQPIGEKKRKAKGDLFVEDIADPAEKGRYLGSPYSISDYTKVNPLFGSMDEFKSLVKECHGMGMKVILDWVGNHTAWDHPWISKNPDWYTKDKNGNITDPLNEEGNSMGWTDVADLNYSNTDMRKAMIEDMKFWIEQCDMDGFRCDVAMSVPADFWDAARKEIEKVKPIFMLAESEEHDMAQFKGAFNAFYGWEMHHVLNEISHGSKTAWRIDTVMVRKMKTFPANVYMMNFITNHDENSWKGTEFERMGPAWKVMAVYTFTAPGIPLLYTGQEYGNNKRLRFFEKDTILPQTNQDYYGFYSSLCSLRTSQPALGTSEGINTWKMIPSKHKNQLIFERSSEGNCVWICLNMGGETVSPGVNVPKGKILMGSECYQQEKLDPWGYLVIKRK